MSVSISPIADISFVREISLMNEANRENRYLTPGTKVRYDGQSDGGPEYGVVIHCWDSDEIHAFDCYVAFFGSAFPNGQPDEKPYVLRYAASSLAVIEG